jgi:hypothetical protein
MQEYCDGISRRKDGSDANNIGCDFLWSVADFYECQKIVSELEDLAVDSLHYNGYCINLA